MSYIVFLFADNEGDSQEPGTSGLSKFTINFDDDDDDYGTGNDIAWRLNVFYTKTTPAYSTNIQNTGTYFKLQA